MKGGLLTTDVYGLLYVAVGERTVNSKLEGGDAERITLFLANAEFLGASLSWCQLSFCVLTNDPGLLLRLFRARFSREPCFKIEGAPFNRQVPKKASFYSAHFKLDAIRYLQRSRSAGAGCLLLDLDMVVIDPTNFRTRLDAVVRQIQVLEGNGLGVYDISVQVTPAVGEAKIAVDLSALKGEGLAQSPCWYGGEFLLFAVGPAFAEFLVLVEEVWERYALCWNTLHHVGDEAVMSAALALASARGFKVLDVGALPATGILYRFWGGRIKHKQHRLAQVWSKVPLLHLPQEKKMLGFLASHCPPGSAARFAAARWILFAWLTIRRTFTALRTFAHRAVA